MLFSLMMMTFYSICNFRQKNAVNASLQQHICQFTV